MDIFNKIAKQYVESFGEVLPGFKFSFDNRKDFFFEVYYDFVFVDMEGNIPTEPPVAGGAVGFTINKRTHKVAMLTFCELGLIEQSQREQEEVYEKISNLKENGKSLSWLKSKYDLNSIQLLKIKKALSETNFTKQNVIEELDELILKNR